jgi:hypothetical protein
MDKKASSGSQCSHNENADVLALKLDFLNINEQLALDNLKGSNKSRGSLSN